jgi:autotransporter adhesin
MVDKSKLENSLKAIFEAMADGSKNDAWYAAQLAGAITEQILTAEIAAGSVIVSVSGGVGKPNAEAIGVE